MSPSREMERIGEGLYWSGGRCWRPVLDVGLDGTVNTMWLTVPDDELQDEVFTLADDDYFCLAECEAMLADPIDPREDAAFNAMWLRLAEGSHCDALGGAEYRRVRKEWIEAGFPTPISGFILSAANRPASAELVKVSERQAAAFVKGGQSYEA